MGVGAENIELTLNELNSVLNGIQDVRIGFIGDACLDVYWDIDMRLSELSRETPHYNMPVVGERMYAGGGANAAVNAAGLGAGRVYMLSLVGDDWRGKALTSILNNSGVDTSFLAADPARVTTTFCKPMKKGFSDVVYEGPRIDFDNHSPLTKAQESKVIEALHDMAAMVDVIAVCDQQKTGLITEGVRAVLAGLGRRGMKIVADSRDKIELYRNIIIKPNEVEAARAVDKDTIPGDIGPDTAEKLAGELSKQSGAPVIITLGAKGALWFDEGKAHFAQALPVDPPIDIVGAGDAFLAGFCCACGTGLCGQKSIAFANIVSSVTIKKIGTTGVATPAEVLSAWKKNRGEDR